MIAEQVKEPIFLEEAEKHIKNAWIAGSISAVITFAYSILGTYNDDFRYQHGFDTWSLLDVVLIAGLSYGIFKKNRYCALGLLVYFVGSKFLMAAAAGMFTGGFLSLLFGYYFFQGTRAAFKLHKLSLPDGEALTEKKKRSRGFYFGVFFGSIFILLVFFLLVLGVFSPETEVIPGKQMNKKYLNFVLEQGIVDRSEEIQFWYSDAVGDFRNAFYLFTDKNVVVYNINWENPSLIIPFSDIESIEFLPNPSFLEDGRITLYLLDDSIVYIPVSSDNGGDYKFYNRLMEIWGSYSQEKL